ncbi:hypothetical protein [Clostridium butyricum]|uniref:Uncharacterized protein n=1 Tax=Clostridium butyricum E4 str. BoNT E BL5262 TaxID=632245 RepID=C4IHI4_CLOBU|nr:hypothetical protein [Clostridium butyricum]EEP54692.1 hypothetical protein CLP_2715 [Clostridium butyricum E4 str. BoNT E BL5262]
MSKTLKLLLKLIREFEIEEIKNLMNYGLTLKETLRCYEVAIN